MNVYVRELSRELSRRGIAVDIFTRLQDPDLPTITHLDRGVQVINLRAGPAAPYDKNLLLAHMPEFVSHIRCFADSEDLTYDLIHSHYWLSGLAGLSLRQGWGVPMVHMFHTLGALKNRVARSAEERETTRRIMIERQIAQDADMIVAATPCDRADIVWHCGANIDRIRVVPCGVDLHRFQPRNLDLARAMLDLPPSPHRIVLLVGRIEPLKGIDALIGAIALLRERHPEWRESLTGLVVGGSDEHDRSRWNAEQRRLHALRMELGVEDAVRFIGTRPQDQLALFYAAADVVTMPSHYESFGMAALEGLASGRPVVATNAGGPAFLIDDGNSGLLVPPDNPSALANHLEQLLLDESLRATMGVAARQRAMRFGWSTIASEIVRVYCEANGATPLRRSAPLHCRAEAS